MANLFDRSDSATPHRSRSRRGFLVHVGKNLSREEVKEIMMHAAIYAGVPAAFGAFGLAAQIFADMDKEAAAS